MSFRVTATIVILKISLVLFVLSTLVACQSSSTRSYKRSYDRSHSKSYRQRKRRRTRRMSAPRSPRCVAKFDIYELCYKAGRGKSAQFCSTLSSRAKNVLQIPNTNDRRAATTLCTIGCNRALYHKRYPTYWSFSREFCRAR
jgi:hypothetical protein